MKVKCVDASSSWGSSKIDELVEGNIYEGELYFDDYWKEERWKIEGFEDMELKKYRFEPLKEAKEMEKTFREVIADIKEGEVWECKEINRQIVRGEFALIEIRKIDGRAFDNAIGIIVGDEKYKLKRKEYTFEEAFKAYEEGKEIESKFLGEKFKKIDDEDYMFNFDKEKYILLEWDKDAFNTTMIRGKWYINN